MASRTLTVMGFGSRSYYRMNNHATSLPEPDGAWREPCQGPTLTHALVQKINHRTQQRLATYGAIRVQVAFFRCPWPCTKALFDKVRRAEVNKWIHYMEKTGWQLVGNVRTAKREKWRRSYDLRGDWYTIPAFDFVDIPVAAAFKKLNMAIVRTEVPVSDN